MVQNFKVGSQFRAEQWLVNALKHMLGVGYQLLIPKSERIVITKYVIVLKLFLYPKLKLKIYLDIRINKSWNYS